MQTNLSQILFLLSLAFLWNCTSPQTEQEPKPDSSSQDQTPTTKAQSQDNPLSFIPKGYALIEKIEGDLNRDGSPDCVLFIKATDKNKLVLDEDRGELDKNRRGLIVLLNKNKQYQTFIKNYDCFSSEHEDGGVYFAPELSISIKNGDLYLHYAHGRYGYYSYTFRLENQDLNLIAHVRSEGRGPVIERETQLDFLAKKKQEKVNTNENAQDQGQEVFKTSSQNIKIPQLIKLSEIKDFDELDLTGF